MEKKSDTNEVFKDSRLFDNMSTTRKQPNLAKNSKQPKPFGNQPSGVRMPRLTKRESNAEIKIVLFNDDEDAKLPHIPDMAKPLYDPRRYFSYKFRHSPTRKPRFPVSDAKAKAARQCVLDPTKRYTCLNETDVYDMSFATRYPNYLGDDFKFIKYPPLENVAPPEFQSNRPRNTTDIYKDFDDFTLWRKQVERRYTSSSEDLKPIRLGNLNNETQLQSSFKERVSPVQVPLATAPLVQESSELLSKANVTLKGKRAEAMVGNVFDGKVIRNAPLKTTYRTSDPLSKYCTSEKIKKNEEILQREFQKLLEVPEKPVRSNVECDKNIELPKQANLESLKYQSLQKEMNPSPSPKQTPTEIRSKKPPKLYEDFKEELKGPKPPYWIDFKETGEIGKTVAIYDSRDFKFCNENIKPMWIDKDFDFHTPIPEDFHEFSKIFMTSIPFYDNENEELKKFAQEYKLLRAGPKYNIQFPPLEKKVTTTQETKENLSGNNIEKESAQNDTSTSETKILELQQSVEKKLQQSVETKLKQSVETKLQQSVETKLQQSVETKLHQSVETKFQQPVETKLDQSVETKLQQSVETKLQQSVEIKLQQSVETKLQQPVETNQDTTEATKENLATETETPVPNTPEVETYASKLKKALLKPKVQNVTSNETQSDARTPRWENVPTDPWFEKPSYSRSNRMTLNADKTSSPKQQAEKSTYKTKNAQSHSKVPELKQQAKNLPEKVADKSQKAKKAQMKTDLKEQAKSSFEKTDGKESAKKKAQTKTEITEKKKKKSGRKAKKAQSHTGDSDQPVEKILSGAELSKKRKNKSKSNKGKENQNPKSQKVKQQTNKRV